MIGGNKRDKGFSYLEVVLALAVISYIVLAFTQLLISNSVSVKDSEFKTIASTYATDYLEDIKHMEYDSISTGTWASESDQLGQEGKVFTRQATVSEIAPGLREVVIDVTWTDMTGSRNLEMTSLIASY